VPAPPDPPRRPAGGARLAIVLFVTALNLRMAIAALPPVLGDIERDTGMSSTGAGLLTTMPVLCFGAFALAAPALIRRLGMERLLVAVLLVITAGIALRVLPAAWALFAGTAVLGMAIAIGNVLFPGLIKQDFPGRAALMTGLYSVALFAGPAISAGLTVPVMRAAGLGWRPAIAIWGALAVACAALLAPHALRRPRPVRGTVPVPVPVPGAAVPAAGGCGPARPGTARLRTDPVAWMVASFMGLQSLGYYAVVAWIPTVFAARGMSAGQAGWMLSYLSFPGLTASLVTPLLVRGRARRAAVMVIVATAACGTGYAGLALAAMSWPYLWITVLGTGQGMCISLALGFVVARAPDVERTARLSTMTQGAGYAIASAGPFGLGVLHDLTRDWTVPLLALTVILLPMLITGLGASRDRYVLAPGPAGRARYRGTHRAPRPGRRTAVPPAAMRRPPAAGRAAAAVPRPREPVAELIPPPATDNLTAHNPAPDRLATVPSASPAGLLARAAATGHEHAERECAQQECAAGGDVR
jgi:CP family cyanate transporter-like MFS transporter